MKEPVIAEALAEFNRLHNRELECTLNSVDGDGFTVRFAGTFCRTCGFHDYFDDLQILLEDQYGLISAIEEITEKQGGAEVRYLYK